MLRKIIPFLILAFITVACSFLSPSDQETTAVGYQMISVTELDAMMDAEDFVLVNVHIPLEGNIPGTDLEIPFNEIEDHIALLPENKDEKIIVYCRSGGMGDTASEVLVDLGYTDVSNLKGGYIAWRATDLPFEE